MDLSPQSLTNFNADDKSPSVSDGTAAATAKIARNTQKVFIFLNFIKNIPKSIILFSCYWSEGNR